jgi:hypothetical protein
VIHPGKFVLVAAVGLAHAAVLFFLPLQLENRPKLEASPLMMATLATIEPRQQILKFRPLPRTESPELSAVVLAKPEKPRASRLPVKPKTEKSSYASIEKKNLLQSEDEFQVKFEDAGETAVPPEDIGETLQRVLPFSFGLLILDFSVDSAGNTVEVECVEGDCNPAVIESLKVLPQLSFRPAIKEGVAVASRKSIQIEATNIF